MAHPPLAQAGKKNVEKKSVETKQYVDSFVDVAGPILTNLGASGILGFCAGKALKLVSGVLAVMVGLAFLAIQVGASMDLVTVNWADLEARVTRTLDTNKDGQLTSNDLQHYVNKGVGIMTQGVPSIGGFLAGFAWGLK